MEITDRIFFSSIIKSSNIFTPLRESVCKKLNKQDTQLTFACSKSTIEALEKSVKYVQN